LQGGPPNFLSPVVFSLILCYDAFIYILQPLPKKGGCIVHRKTLAHLLEPSFRLYFIFLAAFALATALAGHYTLAAAEAVVVLALFFFFRRRNAVRQQEILNYIENIAGSMDVAAKDTMVNAPLPMVIFRPETEEIIWSNDHFLQISGERDHLFDRKITDAVPEFDPRWLMEGKSQCPVEVPLSGRRFLVFGHLVRTGEKAQRGYLATTYWVDVTDFSQLRDQFYATRPVTAILQLDNYEEVFKGVSDNVKSAMLSDINRRLDEWCAPTEGLLCRYDRDHYLFVFEERFLDGFLEKKFDVLDQIHEVVNPSGLPATLSIGVGRDADTLSGLFQYASLAVEMALSRGGDQAVVKNRFNFEFYGGRAKETERHNKVKSRVMANAFSELVGDASQVFIMGHSFPDLDCIGPAAGVVAIARKRGVPAHIVRDPSPNPADELVRQLSALPEYERVFLSPSDAIVSADASSLLVVVDTNRPEQVLSPDLLESVNKVAIIDHHRRAASYIEGAALSFHEPYASSASELTTELLQYILEPSDLLRGEAEALMAGIVLDSKNFTMRTGARTFDAAAFLRRAGADTTEVRRFFKSDLQQTATRYEIMKEAKMYRGDMAVSVLPHPVDRVAAAQAADELLSVAGVQASFVLFPDGDRVILSARSLGDTNVQVILEALGGGGNAAVAGAQITGKSVEQVQDELLHAIDKYCEES